MTKPTLKITPLLFASSNFEKGEYWIGDVCYIFPDEFWSEYVGKCFEDTNGIGKDCQGAITEYNGIKFFTCSTSFGDGEYPVLKDDQVIGNCGVDSGGLALVPLSLAQTWPQWEENNGLGVILDIKRDFEIEVFGDENRRKGNWKFLDYEVVTDERFEDLEESKE